MPINTPPPPPSHIKVLKSTALGLILLAATAPVGLFAEEPYIHAYGGMASFSLHEDESYLSVPFGGGLELSRLYLGLEGSTTVGSKLADNVLPVDADDNDSVSARSLGFLGGPTVVKTEKFSLIPVGIIARYTGKTCYQGRCEVEPLDFTSDDHTQSFAYGGGVITRTNVTSSKNTALHLGVRYLRHAGVGVTLGVTFGGLL